MYSDIYLTKVINNDLHTRIRTYLVRIIHEINISNTILLRSCSPQLLTLSFPKIIVFCQMIGDVSLISMNPSFLRRLKKKTEPRGNI